MTVALYALALLCACADWTAVARGAHRWEPLTRPAVLLLVTVAAWTQTQGPHDAWAAPFFLIALVASLVGDVLLMRGASLFLPGVAAFALAHIAYFAGLMPASLPDLAPGVALFVLGIAVVLFRPNDEGLRRSGSAALLWSVRGYAVVISAMLFAAWMGLFRPDWSAPRQLLTIGGASLFYASDAMLAWSRFVAPARALNVPVLVTYHLGQAALASSFAA